MRRLTRLTVVVLLAVVGVFAGTGGASAAGEPQPENPNVAGIGTAPKPDPIPEDPANFDPSNLLTYYGTVGPTLSTYDVPNIEGAFYSANQSMANSCLSVSKAVIGYAAQVANWVFNPQSWSDLLAKPADASAAKLYSNIWDLVVVVILIVAAVTTWAATRGRVGRAMTNVVYVIVGLGLIGGAVASPSSRANTVTGLVSNAVTTLAAPPPPEPPPDVQSDADAKHYTDVAKATVGSRMLGPFYKVSVYDAWLMGTLGARDGTTATKYGPTLFKARAFTWQEAEEEARQVAAQVKNQPGVPDPSSTAGVLGAIGGATPDTYTRGTQYVPTPIEKDKAAQWYAAATDIQALRDGSYEYLQGAKATIWPGIYSVVVMVVVLPMMLVALLASMLVFVALYLLAALLPLIGMAVMVKHDVLEALGRKVGGLLLSAIVLAGAVRALGYIADAVLTSTNPLLGITLVGAANYAAWKFLKSYHHGGAAWSAVRKYGMQPAAVAAGAATGGVGYVAGSWKATRDANKAAEEKEAAEKRQDGAPAQEERLPVPDNWTTDRQADSGQQHVLAAGQGNPWFDPAAQVPEGVVSMDEYRSKHGTTATTSGRAVVVVGQPDNDEEVPASATADRAATPTGHQPEVPHPDAPEHSYTARPRPAAERVFYNPATGRMELDGDQDGPPSVVIARADTPTEETA